MGFSGMTKTTKTLDFRYNCFIMCYLTKSAFFFVYVRPDFYRNIQCTCNRKKYLITAIISFKILIFIYAATCICSVHIILEATALIGPALHRLTFI